jgi:hypothetical protein
MTERTWFRVGARLLGIYWLIVAAQSIPQIFIAAGMSEGPSCAPTWVFVAATSLQAIFAAIAGIFLCIWPSRQPAEDPEASEHSPGADSLVAPVLQLLGVATMVDGARALADLSRWFSYSQPWQIELGQILNAIVGVGLGVLLVLRASVIADALSRYRRR